MSRTTLTAAAFLLLGVAACAAPVDVERESQQLLEADRAWAAAAASGNLDSVVSFWTDDARVMTADQPTYHGKAAIREMVAGFMAIPGAGVTWTPDSAVVAASGDLGYTFGTNAFTLPDSTGTPTVMPGRYLTVWRKEADGRWRCVMDMGTSGTGVP